jgi:capsular polysaccharide biosynthesis protein
MADPLLNASVVKYRLPVNLVPDDLRLFEQDLGRSLDEVRLLELNDIRVSPDGLLFRAGKVLPESFSFDHQFAAWRSRKRRVAKFLFQNYLLSNAGRFEQDALWITDNWSNGYFHWLADALPRLYVARRELPGRVLLLPSSYEQLTFVRDSLKAFDIPTTAYLKPNEVRLCRRLFMPTHVAPSGHHHSEVLKQVSELLTSKYLNAAVEPRRVYISRRDAPRRKITNEDALIELLTGWDFDIVRAEEYTFSEQVQLAARASVLLSNHGAGLTNMLFMRKGSTVIELRNEEDFVNNCYFTMASALDHDYFYLTCKPSTSGQSVHDADLTVDIERVKALLTRLLLNLL